MAGEHIGPASLFEKADGLVTRHIAGETIIVPVRCGVGDLDAIYTLNETGTTIWNLIDGRTGVDRMVQAMTREHEVLEGEAARDLADFLGSLEESGLIRRAREGES